MRSNDICIDIHIHIYIYIFLIYLCVRLLGAALDTNFLFTSPDLNAEDKLRPGLEDKLCTGLKSPPGNLQITSGNWWKITRFNRQIIYKWAMFHSYVKLPDGIGELSAVWVLVEARIAVCEGSRRLRPNLSIHPVESGTSGTTLPVDFNRFLALSESNRFQNKFQ